MGGGSMVDGKLLEKEIFGLIEHACTTISPDVKRLLEKAYEIESKPTAHSMLGAMLENVELAKSKMKPVCQSPGYPTVYVSFGDQVLPGNIKKYFQEALVGATNNGFLRPSMVHPLTRKNSGNNSGEGVPNFEFDYCPDQDFIDMVISLKGCGAELGNAMKIFTPSTLGDNYSGLKKFVLETVINAGGKPCPPFGIGIGIGGQMDVACKLSRKAISTRLWDDTHPDTLYRDLEESIMKEINSLGLGAAGIGGDTVALAVKIAGAHTHTAIAPVAINFHCWVARRAGIRIYQNGRVEGIL
jgi:fumarate hydratase subunit alpha